MLKSIVAIVKGSIQTSIFYSCVEVLSLDTNINVIQRTKKNNHFQNPVLNNKQVTTVTLLHMHAGG